MTFIILFWILLILAAIGLFAPPPFARGQQVVVLILLAILGFKVFGGFS